MDQLERGRGLIQIRKWALKEEREDIEQKQSKVDKIVKFDCLQKKKKVKKVMREESSIRGIFSWVEEGTPGVFGT